MDSLAVPDNEESASRTLEDEAAQQTAIYRASEAMSLTVLCILGMVALAFLLSFLLPNKKVMLSQI